MKLEIISASSFTGTPPEDCRWYSVTLSGVGKSRKLEMISLQTGEAVSVPLVIASTDDSSVRDIRIHTSGLHKRTITPE